MSIELTINNEIAEITLDRPEKHNAFDDGVIAELIDAFEQAGVSKTVRVIVLRANGKHFSAGADLGWMRRMADMDRKQNRADARELARLMSTIANAPRPVICRVQGAAFGGALGLICASDIAIASDNSRFCLSEVKLGILPAVISPYVVAAMGPRQARRYFMSAEVIPATRAQQLGLVHEVVAEQDLDNSIDSCIEALLAGAPGAQLAARSLIDRVGYSAVDKPMLDYTADLIAELRTGGEGREGLSAFLEKREPEWRLNGGKDD